MKKNILFLLLAGLFGSCLNNEYLERLPLNKQSEETFFTTYDNFKSYAWYSYQVLTGYPRDINDRTFFESNTDNCFQGNSANNPNPYTTDGKIVIPTAKGGNGWSFTNIRRINVMLDNIDGSVMTQTDKDHWRSVGYVFKSIEYFNLISRFGDVTWEEHTVTDQDKDILYGPRTPRVEVASKVLDMLLFAKAHIKPGGDGPNTINLDVVNALISRFGLFEGTWRKYHKIADAADSHTASEFLEASFAASSELINKYPTVNASYEDLFNSENLASVTGVLMYRNWYSTQNLGHNLTSSCRTANMQIHEMSASAIQAYLCNDGRPISTSAVYQGGSYAADTASMYREFRNRDRRLYYTICPPYKVNTATANSSDAFTYTGNPEDRFYIDSLKNNNISKKALPLINNAKAYLREMPHVRTARYNMSQTFMVSTGGYYICKYYNITTDVSSTRLVNGNDAPLFRMGEVRVNHAEAAWELGKAASEIEKAINPLRARAGVAPMIVANIDANFDLARDKGPSMAEGRIYEGDYEVDPVLWEIRRERRIELIVEGFRFDDLRRWRKGKYMNQIQLGAYVKKTDFEDSRHVTEPDITKFTLAIYPDPDADAGRLMMFKAPNLNDAKQGWQDKYYLFALSHEDLTLNPALKQNPGYGE